MGITICLYNGFETIHLDIMKRQTDASRYDRRCFTSLCSKSERKSPHVGTNVNNNLLCMIAFEVHQVRWGTTTALSNDVLLPLSPGHYQLHHYTQHDVHQDLAEVWPMGGQQGQHGLRPGLRYRAAAASGEDLLISLDTRVWRPKIIQLLNYGQLIYLVRSSFLGTLSKAYCNVKLNAFRSCPSSVFWAV